MTGRLTGHARSALRATAFLTALVVAASAFGAGAAVPKFTLEPASSLLRFTVEQTQHGFIAPATHDTGSSTDPTRPPMGLRLRLKANFDLTPFHGESLVVLTALKKYGMIVADNGSNWYISGATDSRWNDDDLNQLKTVPGTAFEVVDTGPIQH